jgi:hypothetical protein
MKRRFIAGTMLLLGAFLFAQEAGPGGAYIQEFTGTVELKTSGTAEWRAVRKGDRINKDTMISTGFNSTALIVLENSTLTVRPLTRLNLEELQNTRGNELVNLHLQTGRIRAEVSPPTGGKTNFTVRSPVATASVRGTAFDFDGVNLRVDQGQVHVTGKDGIGVRVGAGHESVSNPVTGGTRGAMEMVRAELTFSLPAAVPPTARPASGSGSSSGGGPTPGKPDPGPGPAATDGEMGFVLDW